MRTKYYQLRKVCKSLYRKPKRRYDQKLIKGFGALETTDPNNFWNLLKQFKTGGKFVPHKEELQPHEALTKSNSL